MANGIGVQFAVFSAIAVVLTCLLITYRRRKAQGEPSHNVPQVRLVAEQSQSVQPQPMQTAAPRKPPEADRQVPPTITMETASTNAPLVAPEVTPLVTLNSVVKSHSSSSATSPAVVIGTEGALATQKDHNERILAGISENIRKSLQTRPVPQHSPIPYSELKPRNTEYVRIKKEIITPHSHIRFSILKDWVSINMLAVFRRASLDWETPDDLIAFLPAYLQPNAEILNGQVLLIGTSGHNEKLAVPIRSLDAESGLRDCFDFVTDGRTATNLPAVLLLSDADFDVVSRGVIQQTVFMNAVEQGHTEVKRLVERSPKALQEKYSAALRGMESTTVAERLSEPAMPQ